MQLLVNIARLGTLALLVGFGAVALAKLLQTNSFGGLLRTCDGSPSPARTQMLVLTVLTAVQYVLTVMHDPSHLPVVPHVMVAAVGGSHGIYLGSKAWAQLGSKGND
jgi:hypothetical protein